LPYAIINVSKMSNTVLCLCIIGLLCIMFIASPDSKNFFKRNINYFIGFIFIATAIALTYNNPQP